MLRGVGGRLIRRCAVDRQVHPLGRVAWALVMCCWASRCYCEDRGAIIVVVVLMLLLLCCCLVRPSSRTHTTRRACLDGACAVAFEY